MVKCAGLLGAQGLRELTVQRTFWFNMLKGLFGALYVNMGPFSIQDGFSLYSGLLHKPVLPI